MAKQQKRTKKFVKNKLEQTIKDRKDWKKKSAAIQRSKQQKDRRDSRRAKDVRSNGGDDAEEDGGEGAVRERNAKKGGAAGKMSVDDFLGGGFKKGLGESDDEEEDGVEAGEDEDEDSDDDDDEEEEDEGDLSDIEELSDGEGEMQAPDLQKLAKSDPEFFKYLQDNDKELLDFDADEAAEEDENDDDEEMEEDEDEDEEEEQGRKGKKSKAGEQEQATSVLTSQMLRQWQKNMLQTHSLRAFRRLLLAFRSAADMGDDAAEKSQQRAPSFVVTDAAVFDKLVVTTLKYVPHVLQHHIPAREQSNGKFKLPTNSKKYAALQRSVQSYFVSVHKLLRTLAEPATVYACVSESVRMVPYLVPHRRLCREHIKILLELWTSAAQNVRIAAFLALRRVAAAGDGTVVDVCLRGAYHGLVRNSKTTTIHTLEGINLLKNSASELYSLDMGASYEHAFGFIRQLAIHLRGCLQAKTKESFQQVYNWQFVHSIDFWSLVLSQTCALERGNAESPMQALIYPLVQVTTGAMRLLPTSRYFPFRFHLLTSLLRLSQRTGVYIPLAPYLVDVFDSADLQRRPKPSTLAPLNLDVTLRAPANYVRTRTYADQIAGEASHLLLEFLAGQARNIALPEMVVAPTVQLRRLLKTAAKADKGAGSKWAGQIRTVLDKAAQNAQWIQTKRADVEFAPNDMSAVERFLSKEAAEVEAPLEVALRLARKVRKQKRDLLAAASVQVDDEE